MFYIIMKVLRYHMAALSNAPFSMPNQLVDPLEATLRKREALVYSDLHYTGNLLNPHLIYNMDLHDGQHTMVGLIRVF